MDLTKKVALAISALLFFAASAQAKQAEMPPSFQLSNKNQDVPLFQAPKLDLEAIKAAHQAEEAAGAAPKFAAAIKANINPENSGKWTSFGKNQSLWRYKVTSKEAKSINLGFTDFYLPEGAKLFVYSPDYKHVRGPFTANHNNKASQLWTPIVFGEEVVVEVLVPSSLRGKLRLNLTSINHDYRGFGQRMDKSGACNVDVACREREGWESQIQSVAVISTGGRTFCTGFLVNNTAQDQKPLFMTADHCGIGEGNAASLVAYWNYENSDCREVGSSASGSRGNGSLEQFTTGATFRAGGRASDFTIVEFNSEIDPAFEVFYAGWNATTDDPTSTVAIHHPATDEKRISFDFDPATTSGYGTESRGDASHIMVHDWDIGTTEPGSSGSPLFDQDGRVVGQLHGGGAACGNDRPDWYGRISTSWELGLREVLDPIGTGETFVDGIGFEIDFMVSSGAVQLSGLGENGVADPGETVEARIVLKNRGKNDVEDLDFQLMLDTEGVVIANPTRENLTLAVGEEIELIFNLEISPDFECGQAIGADFTFLYAEKEGRGRFEMQTGEAVYSQNLSEPNLSIPDNNETGVMDTIEISGNGGVVDANRFEVIMNLTHTYIGDLRVSLVAPNGTEVMLHRNSGGSSDNIMGTYPTTLSPHQGFEMLNGVPVDGTWTLKVSDHANADLGQVNSWSIRQFERFVCE